MSWDNVKDAIGKYAPLLASLVGGPKGFAAQAIIAKVLGTSTDPTEMAQALSDPYSEVHLKIEALEKEHEVELTKLALEAQRLETEDRSDARNKNTGSDMPAFIVIALTLMAGIYGYSLMFFDISEENRPLVIVFATQLMTLWGGAVAYWVGTAKKNGEDQTVRPRIT